MCMFFKNLSSFKYQRIQAKTAIHMGSKGITYAFSTRVNTRFTPPH